MSKPKIAAERVRALLDYDSETGVLTWRSRPPSAFEDGKHSAARKAAAWNVRLAGKRAGTLSVTDGYRHVSIDNCDYREHRIIWLWWHGEWPADQLDHDNHSHDDNRICNLIESTDPENRRNLPLRRDNKSGQAGVYWNRQKQQWFAAINTSEKRIFLGAFERLADAISTRKLAEAEHGYHKNHGV
ncbi:HNH endonuclease [Mesorhizobium sp. M0058]|uniref:HNH endonuclease n=1 Tax=Mesorhizobium sp. M0058 TaxID=2956865 RepID=UPI0033378DAF